jgi:hypothetical protein
MATSDKNAAPSTDLQLVTNSGVVLTRNSLEEFHARMLDRAQFVNEDRSSDVMAKQALQILAASETGEIDEIMRADMGGTVQAKDAGTLEVEIEDMDPVVSTREDIESGHGYYISMNCTVIGGDEDMLTRNSLVIGGPVVLQTGADLFVLKMAGIEKAGALPYRGRVVVIPTRSGNTVVKLGALPKRLA